MKQLSLTFVFIFCISSFTSAQLDTSSIEQFQQLDDSYFVYLYGDKIIKGKTIYSRNPWFKSAYVQIDSLRYQGNAVEFYQNEEGLFANINRISYGTIFIPCVEKGKINLFEYERTNDNEFYDPNSLDFYGGVETKSYKYYYNSGFSRLKEANYSNLSMDLQDNPQAMLHLENYQSQRKLSVGLTAGGIVLMAAGSVSIISKFARTPRGGNVPGVGIELGLIGTGGILSWIAYFIGLDNRANLTKAVKTYNVGF
jgi:hypothetical protein